ncbi:MAG: TfoX/Sxy family protein [Clostridia bacterium]|nr:TfoX/Sxy family protein [Clostridia bacterium]
MATSKEFIDCFTETLSSIEGISCRAMMGEYVLYYHGKVIGGIYDNRVLVKDIPSARKFLPEARSELPYDGAKLMLYLEDFENCGLVKSLFDAMSEELPAPKKRK